MATDITSLLEESQSIPPPHEFVDKARINEVDYHKLYQQSMEDPEGFWKEEAEALDWIKPFEKVREGADYFVGGKINASVNCLDRHLAGHRRNKAAIVWQGEDEEERRTLTYQQLFVEVCRLANALKAMGIKKGSCVSIYLPMVPELAIAMLACARIGAVHSVVFSAFSAPALRDRIRDGGAELVITADSYHHNGKAQRLKDRVDDALSACPTVRNVLVYRHTGLPVEMQPRRDLWWHEECYRLRDGYRCEAEAMDANDPLYILYTSGSTGTPKRVSHNTGGYLLYAHTTFRDVFDYKDEDLFWCTGDIGWVTGHSYEVYGPLSNGATILLYEGAPQYPLPDRFWQIIEQHRVNILYTAPTAIRALMRQGDDWPEAHDLSSLRLLGTVGEPINKEAWLWFYRVIGKEKCPIVDTWWQTESGGVLISTLPGAHAMKPGAAGFPYFGIVPEIVDDHGKPVQEGHGGSLVIKSSWPGMSAGQQGQYVSGDSAREDHDGYYWLMGRLDDVINVAAHRFSTAEIESALDAHEAVGESAAVGIPHETRGQAIYCFVTLKGGHKASPDLEERLIQHVCDKISPIAKPQTIHFLEKLPKTRAAKTDRPALKDLLSHT